MACSWGTKEGVIVLEDMGIRKDVRQRISEIILNTEWVFSR